jgi:hypothetical protein
LRGESVPAPTAAAEAVLAAAKAEGVTALVARQLALGEESPLRHAFADAARGVAAVSLLHAAECRRIFALLDRAGIPALLLKGPALAAWLYPAPYLRECGDIDLLLPSRAEVARAARVFGQHGYDSGYEQGEQAYELVCRRDLSASMQVDIDLHWALNNAPVFAGMLAFDELRPAAIALPSVAPNALGLAPAHALLHACMHRAINLYTGIGDRLKWLYDLHLLAGRLSAEEWTTLLEFCRRRDVGSVCLSGLDAAAEWFGPAAPADAMAALRSMPLGTGVDGTRLQDWHYMHRMNLRALPGWRARLSWLARKAFPTIPHMREMYGNHGVPGLWRARVRELLRKAR